ncbi:MAG: Zn-dependent hydrolase [Gemmatimonadaceae bacterium]|nr:Zn-dependent hydrolase [Gemmatimonadaceae bacterium]
MDRRHFLHYAAALAAGPLVGTSAGGHSPVFQTPLRVNGERLNRWLTAFDAVGRTPGGINRVAYSDADLAGRAFTMDLYRQAGLTPRIDAIGNIFGRLPGADPSLPPIVIGSHVDSVTDGGNFDGPVGTFGAIEVARSLQDQRRRLRHPLDVVTWSNEEGGTIGSALAIGALGDADLERVARSGITIRDGIRRIGGDPARIGDAILRRGEVAAYLELHIEQGGRLEQAGRQIGVVEGIVGLHWLQVTVTGMANHAGATPMDQRQDALLAAARFTVAVNEEVRRAAGRTVATVGRLVVSPNTTNIIPAQVVLTVDLRDLEAATIARFAQRFRQLGAEIAAATDTRIGIETTQDSAPALATPSVMDAIDAAAGALGLSRQRMPSGAGHDAQEMARIAPMGMIFIPSVGGISHSPREFSRPEDIANGAHVLLNSVIAIDQQR